MVIRAADGRRPPCFAPPFGESLCLRLEVLDLNRLEVSLIEPLDTVLNPAAAPVVTGRELSPALTIGELGTAGKVKVGAKGSGRDQEPCICP